MRITNLYSFLLLGLLALAVFAEPYNLEARSPSRGKPGLSKYQKGSTVARITEQLRKTEVKVIALAFGMGMATSPFSPTNLYLSLIRETREIIEKLDSDHRDAQALHHEQNYRDLERKLYADIEEEVEHRVKQELKIRECLRKEEAKKPSGTTTDAQPSGRCRP